MCTFPCAFPEHGRDHGRGRRATRLQRVLGVVVAPSDRADIHERIIRIAAMLSQMARR